MSGKAVGWALDQALPLAEKMVLVVLGDAASNEDFSCYPSIPRLAALAGVSERKARYCLAALETAGLIAVEERYDPSGRRTSNRYVLAVAAAQDVAADPAQDAGTPAAVQGGDNAAPAVTEASPDPAPATKSVPAPDAPPPAQDARAPAQRCRGTLHTGAGAYEPSEGTNPPLPPQGAGRAAGAGARGRPPGAPDRKQRPRRKRGTPPPDPAFEALAARARPIAQEGLRLSAEGRQAAREGWGREWALAAQGEIIDRLKDGEPPPDPALLRLRARKLFAYYRSQAAV